MTLDHLLMALTKERKGSGIEVWINKESCCLPRLLHHTKTYVAERKINSSMVPRIACLDKPMLCKVTPLRRHNLLNPGPFPAFPWRFLRSWCHVPLSFDFPWSMICCAEVRRTIVENPEVMVVHTWKPKYSTMCDSQPADSFFRRKIDRKKNIGYILYLKIIKKPNDSWLTAPWPVMALAD